MEEKDPMLSCSSDPSPEERHNLHNFELKIPLFVGTVPYSTDFGLFDKLASDESTSKMVQAAGYDEAVMRPPPAKWEKDPLGSGGMYPVYCLAEGEEEVGQVKKVDEEKEEEHEEDAEDVVTEQPQSGEVQLPGAVA